MAVEAVTLGLGALGLGEALKKPPKPKTPGAPPAPVEGETDTAKKPRKYRPAAQLFANEDLRLGAAGKLGM